MVKFKKYDNNGSIVVSYHVDGKRYRPTFKTLEDADRFIEQKTNELEVEKAKQLLNVTDAPIDLPANLVKRHEIHAVLKDYLIHIKSRSSSHRSYVKYRNFCNRWYRYFFDKKIDYLDQIDLTVLEKLQTDWLEEGLKPDSINRIVFGALEPFLTKCVKLKLIPNSPTFVLDRLVCDDPPGRRIWKPAEAKKIKATIDDWAQDFLTGLDEFISRPIELSRLLESEIDFENKVFPLWSYKGKGSKKRVRWIPFTEKQKEFLLRRIQYNKENFPNSEFENVFRNSKGRPVNPEHFARVIRTSRRANGLKDDLVPYAKRHEGISDLEKQKASLASIQKLAGQSNNKTTFGYMHHELEDLRNVVEIRSARKAVGGDS